MFHVKHPLLYLHQKQHPKNFLDGNKIGSKPTALITLKHENSAHKIVTYTSIAISDTTAYFRISFPTNPKILLDARIQKPTATVNV
jgi:hypothetical protein